MIPVIINGARGKMGQLACDTIEQHPDFNLAAALSREDNLVQAIAALKHPIVIDLTRADCVYANALTIIEAGAYPIIGTSGLTESQIQYLKQLCTNKQVGGIIAPNFSLGAILMMRFAAEAAKYLPHAEIIEAHHTDKFDAPSGTAQKTAQLIERQPVLAEEKPSYESLIGVRGGKYERVPIHSVRLPGFLAQQQVIFGSQGETLTITHNSLDRSCFRAGIILCCQKVQHLTGLCYGMEHILA